MNIEGEGEDVAPYQIYIAGLDQYDRPNPTVKKVADCWTKEEVRAFRRRADMRYTVVVERKPIPARNIPRHWMVCFQKAGNKFADVEYLRLSALRAEWQ